jgi:hypothetical protein
VRGVDRRAAQHGGYSVEQAMVLRLALGRLCRSLASPSSTRHAVDGTVVEEASPQDREHAARMLAKRKIKAQARQASGAPKPPSPRPVPPKPPAPPEPPPIAAQRQRTTPVFSNSPLTPSQIEARRAALRAALLRPKAATS